MKKPHLLSRNQAYSKGYRGFESHPFRLNMNNLQKKEDDKMKNLRDTLGTIPETKPEDRRSEFVPSTKLRSILRNGQDDEILGVNETAWLFGVRIQSMSDCLGDDDNESLALGYYFLNTLKEQNRLLPMNAVTEEKYWLPDVQKILAELDTFPSIDCFNSNTPYWIIQSFACPSGLQKDIVQQFCLIG